MNRDKLVAALAIVAVTIAICSAAWWAGAVAAQ
jgi:hypothetical protein